MCTFEVYELRYDIVAFTCTRKLNWQLNITHRTKKVIKKRKQKQTCSEVRRNGNGSKLFVESVVVLSDFRVTSKIVVSWWKARTPLGEFVRRVATRSRTCRVTHSGRESLDRAPPPPPSALSSLLAPGRWHCGGHLSWRFSFVFSHPRISNSVTLASRLPAAPIVLRRSV